MEKAASRFQSLPDVKKFGTEKGAAVNDEWDDLPPDDQDNLSTANLLVLQESAEEEEEDPDNFGGPQLTFTRASASPCPSSSPSMHTLDPGGSIGGPFVQAASTMDLGNDEKDKGDRK